MTAVHVHEKRFAAKLQLGAHDRLAAGPARLPVVMTVERGETIGDQRLPRAGDPNSLSAACRVRAPRQESPGHSCRYCQVPNASGAILKLSSSSLYLQADQHARAQLSFRYTGFLNLFTSCVRIISVCTKFWLTLNRDACTTKLVRTFSMHSFPRAFVSQL